MWAKKGLKESVWGWCFCKLFTFFFPEPLFMLGLKQMSTCVASMCSSKCFTLHFAATFRKGTVYLALHERTVCAILCHLRLNCHLQIANSNHNSQVCVGSCPNYMWLGLKDGHNVAWERNGALLIWCNRWTRLCISTCPVCVRCWSWRLDAVSFLWQPVDDGASSQVFR